MTTPGVTLTVAGSDSGGGAGIQADLHTFKAHGMHGTSVLTAITAQNTVGVSFAQSVGPATVAAQLDAVLSDFRVRAVKTGMLADVDTLDVVADYARKGRLPQLVVDPVMVTTSGDALFEGEAERYLYAFADVPTLITPNRDEAERLSGRTIADLADARLAAKAIACRGPQAVLVKGGHLGEGSTTDLLYIDDHVFTFSSDYVPTPNTHGTGCTLSAAIAAQLAMGRDVYQAIDRAKKYLTRALRRAASWRLGAGPGPVEHASQQGE
ncbi:bifunctional hydroxymethylpyrimidine kinase/phosphomethylpyrimidine kinase [Haloglycomyces albus]|uniref:bifunctional hydroxymethylpyrimidine kinase/phosphomethylpyrimidine kinase n=1 Tax=Haloglycomyces albus TaxID=526067 RepID=UPI00046CA369|nr:bifunctional hydroxymethylpyrimidine kinase/phosphomethylpyrimidine kinase [Haloglycomyces albus]